MATIESYQTAAGKRYRVRYRTPDRRTTQKRGFTTKRQAQDFAATVEVAKLSGTYIAPSLGRVTVAELAPIWLARKEVDLKPAAYRPLESAWRIHVQPRWGTTSIVDIESTGIERWIAEMGRTVYDRDDPEVVVRKGSGATTIIRAHSVLSGVLAEAAKERRIASNPAPAVENLPRKASRRHIYLSHDDVSRLAREARKHRVLVLTLAYTGIRWGEAVALRVRDLELLRRRLTVSENAVESGAKIHVGTPKSHKIRTVPIPAFVCTELARQCEGKSRDELVFPGEDGNHLRRPKAVRGWFDEAVKRSGIERITPHDLRHTTASLAISAGVNVKALQRMLGHASAAMTLDVYADLFSDDLDAVAVALDTAASPSSVAKAWPRGV